MREFAPPLHTSGPIAGALRDRGFVVLGSDWTAHATGLPLESLSDFAATWNDLPPDPYLKDGGHYRRRRHSSFVVEGVDLRRVPHRPHFQSSNYNALHGGMERWFLPLDAGLADHPAFHRAVVALGDLCSGVAGARPWFVEAHQFRIDTHEGIGRPTPEGAHRDGVDFVAIFFVARAGIKGGETRVFEAATPSGLRFTLAEPWSLLFLDDARVIHESTPIQPCEPAPGGDSMRGHRDTLVLTFRRGGFQEP
jgi:hypothetical protein